MGEYAKIKGSGAEVKIGTCEDMLYLRWDQANQVWPQHGNVDPIKDSEALRFRFPWPDEDNVTPGEFKDHDRGLAIWGATVPDGVEHYKVQFVASAGYNVCLPCPESPQGAVMADLYTVHRNGFGGPVRLVQQAWRDGRLVAICECGGCGAKYRVDDPTELVASCLSEVTKAERDESPSRAEFWLKIAQRIEAGYLATLKA